MRRIQKKESNSAAFSSLVEPCHNTARRTQRQQPGPSCNGTQSSLSIQRRYYIAKIEPQTEGQSVSSSGRTKGEVATDLEGRA